MVTSLLQLSQDQLSQYKLPNHMISVHSYSSLLVLNFNFTSQQRYMHMHIVAELSETSCSSTLRPSLLHLYRVFSVPSKRKLRKLNAHAYDWYSVVT
jgi:hypothetical protein